MKGKGKYKAKLVKAAGNNPAASQPVATKPQEIGSAKVIEYGKGNKLPHEIISTFLASPTARRCWLKLKKFIQADGFSDKTAAAVKVNPTQRADDLLPLIAWDAAPFGFALRVKYNLGHEVAEVYHVPFQTVRRLDDGRFLVNPTLGTDKYKKEEDEILDAFDNTRLGIRRSLKQVDAKGRRQPGQLLYVFEETSVHPFYPEPAAWAAKEDILSDTEIQRADYNAIHKRVKPNVGVFIAGEIDDETKDEANKTEWDYIEEQVSNLTDPDGEGDAVVFNGPSKEDCPQILDMPGMKNTLAMDAKSETIRKRICMAFGLHPSLIGMDTTGQLGNTQQLLNIIQLTQQEVLDIQGKIQSVFAMLFPIPNIDWTVSSLSIIKAVPEQQWQTMDENERRNFLGLIKVAVNEKLNQFNRLPDALKEKLLENMTPEQILELTGLELTEKSKETPDAAATHKGGLSKVRASLKKLIGR